MEGMDFLKQKYNLQNSPEVESAAKRTEARTDEPMSQKPREKIQNYLDRFKEIIEREDPEERERGMDALKSILHDKYVMTQEEVPEAYFDNQRRIAREQGHGDVEVSAEMRREMAEVIATDQESSMDKWIDYLSSSDATYPDWLKYFAIRSVLGMGSYDKEKHAFTKRSKGTTTPYPDLNREALAYVLDAIEKKQAGIKNLPPINIETDEAEYKKFEDSLKNENFAKLYAWAIEQVTPASEEALANIEGKWVKYEEGTDHMPLVVSLQGHGTGWCTAGESTAEAQLKMGDFHVYYSLDKAGNPTVPRVAIRMEGKSIAEVRGISAEQNLDQYIGGVVQEKLKDFPDGELYEKKAANMKLLTVIENKFKKGGELSKEDLTFLYEIDEPITGFGYQKDPRIEELRSKRDSIKDQAVIFGCTPEEIARRPDEVNEKTKAYVGNLFPGIFNKGLEHIYSSFPEDRIQTFKLEIGGKTKEDLIAQLKEKTNIVLEDYAEEVIRSDGFKTEKNVEFADFVRILPSDLGFNDDETTTLQLYDRAAEFGLELCPAEVGPLLRLSHSGEMWMYIAMTQIKNNEGASNIFGMGLRDSKLSLATVNAPPSTQWIRNYPFVFRLRQKAKL